MEITDEVKTLSEKHLKTSLENNANHTAREPGPEKPGPEEPGPEKPGPEKPGPEGPGPEKPGPEKPGPDGPGPDGPRLEELTPVEETDDKSEIDDNSDEDDAESGDESDIEDNDQQDSAMDHLFPSQRAIERPEYPNLPDTVTTLETADGSKVYIVGTAHFSEESQADVAQTIQECKPDIVMVELCPGRVSILSLDEKTLLEEAKTISIEKLRTAIKQSGFVQGIMHLLLLNMSAHLTQQLGMAPGGEFRRAFTEARLIPGCRIHLGDRPIQITLQRAFASLSWWQTVRLAWHMFMSKDPISKEDVEKCKQKDLLEEMLKEMTGEFPALSRVFVDERDQYLAHSLRSAAHPLPSPDTPTGFVPTVVVGVVGIGHVQGLAEYWDKHIDLQEIMRIPPRSMVSHVFRWTLRASLVGLLSWACYRLFKGTLNKAISFGFY